MRARLNLPRPASKDLRLMLAKTGTYFTSRTRQTSTKTDTTWLGSFRSSAKNWRRLNREARMQRNQLCCLTLGAVWAMHSGHWLRTLACLLSRSNAATSHSALSISSKKTSFGKPNILTLNRVIWSKRRFLSLRSQPAFLNLSSCSRPSRLRITKTWPKRFTISWPPELSYTSATTVGTIWLS